MLSCLFAVSAAGSVALPIEVAVTIDDLPSDAAHLQAIRDTLQAHAVLGVVGFANGFMLQSCPTGREAVREWVEAGYVLGSHTYSHGHLETKTADAYCDDIDRNEPFLRAITGSDTTYRVFRYPYRGPFLGEAIRALRLRIPTSRYDTVEWMAVQCLTTEASAPTS